MKPQTGSAPLQHRNTNPRYTPGLNGEPDTQQINVQQDKAYTVDICSGDLTIPPFCTCCMKRCSRFVNTPARISGNYQFPLCNECETHSKELRKKRNLVFILSVLAGVFSQLLLMIFLKPDDLIAFGISAGVMVLSYFALYFGLKLRRLPAGHSSRFESIFPGSPSGRAGNRNLPAPGRDTTTVKTSLAFANPIYAKLFHETNERLVSLPQEISCKNTAPVRSIAKLDKHRVSGFLRALLVFLLFACLCLWLNMSFGLFRNISFEKQEPVPAADSTVSGTVVDATSGEPVEGVLITVENSSEPVPEPVATCSTDESGKYSLVLPEGIYQASFEKAGYEPASMGLVAAAGQQIGNQDCALSPAMIRGQIRIILQWGALPADLDSHLINKDQNLHVYYSSKTASIGGERAANLDLDDVSSYGPETITIEIQPEGKTVYCVHDFTNQHKQSSTALAESGARVTVYTDDGSPLEFTVPDKPGTCWTVFSLEGGTITPINEMSDVSASTRVGQ